MLRIEPVTAVVSNTFFFNMEQSAGYPPVPTFEWFLDAIKIIPTAVATPMCLSIPSDCVQPSAEEAVW